MDEEALPSGHALSMLNPGYRADPHSRLDRIRSKCPVQWDEQAGFHRLLDYDDARIVLADRTLWRDPSRADERATFYKNIRRVPEGTTNSSDGRSSVVFLDDPDHTRVRGAISIGFNRRVAASAPIVRRIVAERLDALPTSGTFDLVAEFAIPIPILVIAAILGVEPDRLSDFREWSMAIVDNFNPNRTPEVTRRMIDGQNDALAYFDAAIKRRRETPSDDLITDLVRVQSEHGTLSDADIRYNCLVMLAAGNLTTADLIGMAVWYVLSTAGALQAVTANAAKVKAVVEETLRIAPSIENTARVASRDLEVNGHSIKQGEVLLCSLIGANHDPSVFSNPHAFDLKRGSVQHLAFGGGAHVCLGAALARIEANIAISALFSRYPRLSLTDPVPRWRGLPSFRGLECLDVSVG